MVPLLNVKCIRNWIVKDDRFASGHGSEGDFIGTGMIYYAIAYAYKSAFSVCLGSGSGFVPKIMRQAQFDLGLKKAKTILVDGNTGAWGRPDYYDGNGAFPKEYGVATIQETTANAAKRFLSDQIEYLHIDAGHSYDDVKQDFLTYRPLLKKNAIVTLHDTRYDGAGVAQFLNELRGDTSLEVLDIGISSGVALVKEIG